jgi:putative membrane protein
MRIAVHFFSSLLLAGPAAAHGPVPHGPDALWHAWSLDPLVLVPLGISVWLYGRGLRLLWNKAGRGRGVAFSNALAFYAGAALLFIALVSPLDAFGEMLLSAHMAQHALLVTGAPVLLLLGKPNAVFAWSLPARYKKPFLASRMWRALASVGSVLSRPFCAAILHGLALWGWHAPGAFDAAVANYGMHVLEHISFFGTAVLFWKALLDAHAGRRAGASLGAAFATLMHSGLLGALITLAPYPLYTWYRGRTEPWGLSALEDQQLAGLIMWVPMGIVYLGACLTLAAWLLSPQDNREGKPSQRP